ncbi:hypothetical protein BO70DRAFT_77542 [Aspergillus heteromorphus CBS 117.55]|uniref:Uncharacterized protein n=1 Tax=Aspergillus heteromorphus CBS 117.55 TaxID=1448321 RepID=A0A317WWI4_9EURO|nr:uncharacterized protein BO70DRAFT_77542 [Aspergillus heteromorphus CBS 117.55]PWY90756.1 hypothetical protein BO70DRAFT_77542 [Aspergillus heteromorphus CBS 117.55]
MSPTSRDRPGCRLSSHLIELECRFGMGISDIELRAAFGWLWRPVPQRLLVLALVPSHSLMVPAVATEIRSNRTSFASILLDWRDQDY